MRQSLQVVGVHAPGVVAHVVDVMTLWPGAIEPLPHQHVRKRRGVFSVDADVHLDVAVVP